MAEERGSTFAEGLMFGRGVAREPVLFAENGEDIVGGVGVFARGVVGDVGVGGHGVSLARWSRDAAVEG